MIITNRLFACRAIRVVSAQRLDRFLGVARQDEGDAFIQCNKAAEDMTIRPLWKIAGRLPGELGGLFHVAAQHRQVGFDRALIHHEFRTKSTFPTPSTGSQSLGDWRFLRLFFSCSSRSLHIIEPVSGEVQLVRYDQRPGISPG